MTREAVMELVTIPDGEYFTVTPERLRGLSRRLSPTADEVRTGSAEQFLILGGPHVVDLQTARQIPVLLAMRVDGQRRWMVDSKQNFTWIITDVDQGKTVTMSPMQLDKRRMDTATPSRSGQPPSDFDARVVGYSVERKYLPPVFGERWPPGRYAVTVASYDRGSNTIVFETKPPRANGARPARKPSAFVKSSPKPLLGDNPANTVHISKGRVGGVIAMPAAGTMVADLPGTPGGALIPVSLVLLKLDMPEAIQIDLMVPAALTSGVVVTRFSFTAADAGLTHLTGEYQAYLCSGTIVIGPQTATFE